MKITFDAAVSVLYVLDGGVEMVTSGVISVQEMPDGSLLLTKSDESFSKIKSYLMYDIQKN